jgi:hypothetical protein
MSDISKLVRTSLSDRLDGRYLYVYIYVYVYKEREREGESVCIFVCMHACM